MKKRTGIESLNLGIRAHLTRLTIAMLLVTGMLTHVAFGETAVWKAGAIGNYNTGSANANWLSPVDWNPDARKNDQKTGDFTGMGSDGQGDAYDNISYEAGSIGAVITLNLEYWRSWNNINTLDIPASNTFIVGATAHFSSTTNAGELIINGRTFCEKGSIIKNTGRVRIHQGDCMISSVDNTGGGTVEVEAGTTWTIFVQYGTVITEGSFLQNGTTRMNAEGNWRPYLLLTDVMATNTGTMTINNAVNSTGYTYTHLSGTSTLESSGTINIKNIGTSASGGTTYFQVDSNATLRTTGTSQINIEQTSDSKTGGATHHAWLNLDTSTTAFTNNGAISIKSGTNTLSTAQLRSSRDVVNPGTITMTGPKSSIVMAGRTLTVTSGGLLRGEPVINGNLAINGGGTLGVGTNTANVGTLSVTGNVTLASGAICEWDCADGAGDLVAVTGTLTLPAVATVNVTDIGGELPDPAILFTSTEPLAGATDLSGWTVTGQPYQSVRIAGNSVILRLPPKGTTIAIQ